MSKLTLLLVFLFLLCLISPSTAWRRRRRRRRRVCGPVHCKWGSWGAYGSCSASCGGGKQTRSRGIAVNPSCGGSGCSGSSSSTRACNTQCCPVNCMFGPWEGFGGCSRTCGGGSQTRMRRIAVPSRCGGAACSGETFDSKPCNTDCCAINCRWSSWGSYTSCSATCGGGRKSRRRRIAQKSVCGGSPCLGGTTDATSCSTQCCSVDCRWTLWSKFSDCSATCGGGSQSRTRRVEVPNSCGGAECTGVDKETKACNRQCCRIDCLYGSWGEYGPCTRTCGGGSEDRTRSIAVYEQCGGTPCSGLSFDSRECNTNCCPTDCRWGTWSQFTSCSALCGGGQMERTRSVINDADCGGRECSGPNKEVETCNDHKCPIDCSWSEWDKWEKCSATCGGGSQMRRRTIETPEQYGGQKCDGTDRESRICNNICCAEDCVWGDWELWTPCSKICGKGSQNRERKIMMPSSCGGAKCAGTFTEERSCNDVCCPVNCAYSEWSDWESCSTTCGDGIQERSRVVVTEPSCDGKSCTERTVEQQDCNAGCCPVNCKMGEWEDWSGCSSTCGPFGVQTRLRSIAVSPECNGIPCQESSTEAQPCNRVCLNSATLDSEAGCLCRFGWSGTCCDDDVDECATGTHDCSETASCINEPGRYMCMCTKGYTGDGFFCEDINECETDEGVCNEPFMACENLPGSYTCNCQESRLMVDGRCLETDICEKGKDNCHEMARCVSEPGTFQCTCLEGFIGDGITCEDINECEENRHCQGPFMGCENTFGKFVCYCLQSRQLVNGQCVGPNECETGAHDCHEMAQCINEPESYRCVCNEGFTGDGFFCEDIDECSSGLHNCTGHFMGCANAEGSFVCVCLQSLKLVDGRCVEVEEQAP